MGRVRRGIAVLLLLLTAACPVRAREALRVPPMLADNATSPRPVEVALVAAPARLTLVPGLATDGLADNGAVPGPTIEAREGDRVVVHILDHEDLGMMGILGVR